MFQYYDAEGGNGTTFKAVYTDGFNIVRVTGQPGNKAAEQAAAVTALNALYGSAPIRQYAVAFLANYKPIFKAFYTMKEAFRTAGASPTLTQYRNALSTTLVQIYSLPPAFTNEFDAEKAGLIAAGKLVALAAAPNYAGSLAIADCGNWHLFINGWIAEAMNGVALAKVAGDLD